MLKRAGKKPIAPVRYCRLCQTRLTVIYGIAQDRTKKNNEDGYEAYTGTFGYRAGEFFCTDRCARAFAEQACRLIDDGKLKLTED